MDGGVSAHCDREENHAAEKPSKGVGERASPSELLGAQGRALTPLRPAGSAFIGGRKVDVVAESDFIAPDEAVVVVREEGLRIVVRKKV